MPTDRPRLTITLTPEINRALDAFSDMTGQSKSSFIVDLIRETVPHLEKVSAILQQANQLRGDARTQAAGRFSRVADRVTSAASELLKQTDMLIDLSMPEPSAGMPSAARKHEHSDRHPAAAASTKRRPAVPPSVNKGVTTTRRTDQTPPEATARGGAGRGGKVVPMRSRKP